MAGHIEWIELKHLRVDKATLMCCSSLSWDVVIAIVALFPLYHCLYSMLGITCYNPPWKKERKSHANDEGLTIGWQNDP